MPAATLQFGVARPGEGERRTFLTILALATAMALSVVGALLVFSLMVRAGDSSALADQPAAICDLRAGRLSIVTV